MQQNLALNFKLQLQAGKNVFGPLIGPGNEPQKTAKALKDFGYDFIMVDNEHSLVGKETIYSYIRAAREVAIPLLMRPEESFANFRCYLDSGVNGLMLPQVNTAEQAAYAVDQAYFPPVGHRGSGIGLIPYLLDFQDPAELPLLALTEYVNNNTMLFPQTESLLTISNLRQILRLEGVTGTIVGTNDLALNIGGIEPRALRADVNRAPFLEEKLKQVARICRDAGKVAGIGAFPPSGCARWAQEGYQLFTLGYVRDGNAEKLRPLIEEAKSLVG
jgi:4-hydroxy-2-oxoheptanedioate aldolase